MQAFHELGHVLGALATGGDVVKVVLHPFTISRTDVDPNPSPWIVVWSGPLIGVVLPFAMFVLWKMFQCPYLLVVRFFSGFCFLANGLYLAVGCWQSIGDCRRMLQQGDSIWLIFISGTASSIVGFFLIHRTGEAFGLGANPKSLRWPEVWSVFSLFVGTVLLEIVLSEKI